MQGTTVVFVFVFFLNRKKPFFSVQVLAGQIYLEKLNDLEATKKIIQEVEKTLDNADGVTAVHGRFYLLASQYYRLV